MHSRIRYRVRSTFEQESLKQSFLQWMEREHGVELLAVPGCLEYRVYEVGPKEIDCEYLFASRAALELYFKTEMPKLREKGKTLFPEGVTFERDECHLLFSSS